VEPWTIALLSLALGQTPPADTAADSPDSPRRVVVAALAQRTIREQQFLLGSQRTPLSPQPDAILRWSNPTVGEVYGDVFVWTDRGRPACVASIYRWFQPDWGASLEVRSLTAEPLIARTGEREFWRSTEPDFRWQSLPELPAPSASPASRLSQMKRLAAEFTATLSDARNVAEPVPRVLRLMPQPLYRYPVPGPNSDYVDGALFAFVEGTDPEVLLLVEAERNGGEPAWRYGLARMNKDELAVTRTGQTVWRVPHIPLEQVLQQTRRPYALFMLNAETGKVLP
jgi:hypothetical protein